MKKILYSLSIMLTIVLAGNMKAQAQHHKLSDQGRGAIIGGAGGAVAGGLIGHGVGGALLGAGVGAGAGYVIGNEHHKHVVRKHRREFREHHTLVRSAKYRYHN